MAVLKVGISGGRVTATGMVAVRKLPPPREVIVVVTVVVEVSVVSSVVVSVAVLVSVARVMVLVTVEV